MDNLIDIERVNSTRLRRDTADLLNRVCYGGKRIIITSSGKERAALVSISDLEWLLAPVVLPVSAGDLERLPLKQDETNG